MKSRTILALLCLGPLLAGGVQASQQQLATSMKETRLEASNTRDQLAATLAALTKLTKQKKGDLRPAYQAFTAEIPKTQSAAALTGARVTWMHGEGLTYFENWQKTIDSISNQSLRKKSQKRLDAAKKSYNSATAHLHAAGDKFKPFLTDIMDIEKALANDITASGVKALRSTVTDTNWRYQALNQSINGALQEMKKMESSLSSEAK